MKKLVVEKDKLVNNINIIKKMTSSTIIAVLKGNGYGLGLVEFARTLADNSIGYFAVSEIDEAILLRNNGFEENSILLLTSTSIEEEAEAIVKHGIMPTVGSINSVSVMNAAAEKLGIIADVHLKIDTGFGRLGFLWNKTEDVCSQLKALNNIRIAGTYTHLSYSFEKKPRSVHVQFEKFLKSIEVMKANGIDPGTLHIANSCAFLKFPAMHLDAVRVGSAFLGRIPIDNPYGLTKIGYLKSRIAEIKDLPKDHYIGYANTYKTNRETRIGIVPVGYKDGFGVEKSKDTFRLIDILRYIYNDIKLLTKHVYVRLEDTTKVRVLGRISMYNIVVDLTGTDAKIGDTIQLEVNPVVVESTIGRDYI